MPFSTPARIVLAQMPRYPAVFELTEQGELRFGTNELARPGEHAFLYGCMPTEAARFEAPRAKFLARRSAPPLPTGGQVSLFDVVDRTLVAAGGAR